MRIAFITDGEPFDGASPEERALGGSETALVQAARALHRHHGCRVEVYCRCPRPGVYHGVLYRDRKDLVQAALEERFEVLIVSRFFTALDLPLQAGLKVLWNHDILDQPSLLAQRLDQLDMAFVLSRFHAKDYVNRLPQCEGKLRQTRNGLDLDLLERAASGTQKVPGQVTYVSRPERGLKQLLEYVWPRLKTAMPELKLKLCGYEVETTELHPRIKAEYALINDLVARAEDVDVLGGLAKEEYYRHLASCQAMLYPAVFPEISCIAALEAQAVGLPVITSDAFALSETVLEERFKVPGEPGTRRYLEDYTARALYFLRRPQEAQRLALESKGLILKRYSWMQITFEWLELFESFFQANRNERAGELAASLLINGDSLAAGNLLRRSIPAPAHEPEPQDCRQSELFDSIASLAGQNLEARDRPGRIGVMESKPGLAARELSQRLVGHELISLGPHDEVEYPLDLLIIHGVLERSADPAWLLQRMASLCGPEGWVLICTASGAWPLIEAGHLDRTHDLGKDELLQLLPGGELKLEYLPRGMVRSGKQVYGAGYWLALARVGGPPPAALDPEGNLRRVRPAADELMGALKGHGLLAPEDGAV